MMRIKARQGILPAGKLCSNYPTEAQTTEHDANLIYDSDYGCNQEVIFTDALTVRQALKSSKVAHLRNVVSKICHKTSHAAMDTISL